MIVADVSHIPFEGNFIPAKYTLYYWKKHRGKDGYVIASGIFSIRFDDFENDSAWQPVRREMGFFFSVWYCSIRWCVCVFRLLLIFFFFRTVAQKKNVWRKRERFLEWIFNIYLLNIGNTFLFLLIPIYAIISVLKLTIKMRYGLGQ